MSKAPHERGDVGAQIALHRHIDLTAALSDNGKHTVVGESSRLHCGTQLVHYALGCLRVLEDVFRKVLHSHIKLGLLDDVLNGNGDVAIGLLTGGAVHPVDRHKTARRSHVDGTVGIAALRNQSPGRVGGDDTLHHVPHQLIASGARTLVKGLHVAHHLITLPPPALDQDSEVIGINGNDAFHSDLTSRRNGMAILTGQPSGILELLYNVGRIHHDIDELLGPEALIPITLTHSHQTRPISQKVDDTLGLTLSNDLERALTVFGGDIGLHYGIEVVVSRHRIHLSFSLIKLRRC